MQPIDLIEHPEGGRFREVYRSQTTVRSESERARCALTHIYFSLNSGEVSHLHRVGSDEVWNLYQGAGLYLYQWDGSDSPVTRVELSASANCFCHVVPAGFWQAAVPLDGTVLVGCSVAPGFEFADFCLMAHDSEAARLLLSVDPQMRKLIIC